MKFITTDGKLEIKDNKIKITIDNLQNRDMPLTKMQV